MKERFLNIFLFIFSLAFITLGVLLMYFQKLEFLNIVVTQVEQAIVSKTLVPFFISFFGSIVFAWGIFFFLMTVYAVMELKPSSVYGFVFWVFSFWAISAGVIFFIHQFYPLLIGLGILYGVIFIPFFLSLPMKSGAK